MTPRSRSKPEVEDGLANESSDTPSMGKRLRQLRMARGLTLQHVADQVGVSKSFLSQVEHGLSNPSIHTLRSIAEALHVPIFSLFAASDQRNGTVVRRNERTQVDSSDSGVRYELLSPNNPDSMIEVVLTDLGKGQATGERPRPHAGEECTLVLRGRVRVEVEDEKFELEEGDSIWLQGNRPHRLVNSYRGTTQLLSIVSPPSF